MRLPRMIEPLSPPRAARSRRSALRVLCGLATIGAAYLALDGRGHAKATATLAGVPAGAPDPSRQVTGPAAGPDASFVLAAVASQFMTMAATRYQHHDVENPQDRTYFYDCVGMVTYTLRQGAPKAMEALLADLGIRRGYVPNPAHYLLDDRGQQPAPVAGGTCADCGGAAATALRRVVRAASLRLDGDSAWCPRHP